MGRRRTIRGGTEWIPLDELVVAAAAGGHDAAAEIIRRFRPMACAYAARMVSAHVAEDVAHDALVEVLDSLAELRQPFALPLLVRLSVLKHADRYRRGHRDRQPIPAVVQDEPEDSDPAHVVLRRDLVMTVRAALQAAPEPDRRLLELRYIAEWSIRDLAAVTGLTEGATRKRLHDARRRLRSPLTAADLAPSPRSPAMSDPTACLGNTYAADGSYLDDRLDRVADRAPLPDFGIGAAFDSPGAERLTTGLKVIDTLAALTRGGRHDIVGPFGTGHLVLVRELVARAGRSRPTACVAVGSRSWHKGGFSSFHKFGGTSPDRSRFTVILGAAPQDAAPALDRGSRLARALTHDRDVILAVDDCTAFRAADQFATLRNGLTADGHTMTVLHVDCYGEGFDAPERPGYDARISLSLQLAATGLFPAIDPAASRSALLEGNTPEGERARRARALLAAAQELTDALAQGLVADDADRQAWIDPSVAAAEVDGLITQAGGS